MFDTNTLSALLKNPRGAQGATLATHNLRDFQRVPGLRVEDWLGAAA